MRTEQFSLPLATSTQVFDTLVRVIRYDEGSGTGTAKIRIKSLSGGAFDVEMVPGRQIKLPEIVRGLHISNLTGSAITGKITIGSGDISDNSLVGTVTLDAATLTALESVDLNSASLNTLNRPESWTATYVQNSALVANTPDTVFAPASNTAGAIVQAAQSQNYPLIGAVDVFLLKNGTPAGVNDGSVIAQSQPLWMNPGATHSMNIINVQRDIFVPAGLGLYFISSGNMLTTFSCNRYCRYKLL